MIYGIAENPWPTGKYVKYASRHLGGLKLFQIFNSFEILVVMVQWCVLFHPVKKKKKKEN